MGETLRKIGLLATCVLLASSGTPSRAATVRVVANLVQYGQPNALIEGHEGVFYLHAFPPEVIASVTTQGIITTLASFSSPPYNIQSNPGTVAANGLVYSSVEQISNNSGNVFSMGSAANTEQTYPNQGFAPSLAVSLPDGRLFGLAYGFTVGPWFLSTTDLKGNVTTFYQFSVNDRPGTPIYGSDGNYYGVSANPVISETSSFFYRVTPAGSYTQVATLPFIVTGFQGGGLILEGTDGNFYGIQSTGLGCSGGNQHGGVYELTPSGQYTLLHDFGVCASGVVSTLIEASDGKLYGATEANVIFSLTKAGAYKEVDRLNGTNGICDCGLVQGHDGVIYGVASGGGSTGGGTVFAVDLGLPTPRPRALRFNPTSGTAGTQVLLWGYNLFGATVQFNGVPATTVHNAGPNYVWATVPAGATSGTITVTTPGGSSTTHTSFTVR